MIKLEEEYQNDWNDKTEINGERIQSDDNDEAEIESEEMKSFVKEENKMKGLLSNWKWNKDTFLILILVGILLFIIAMPTSSNKNASKQSTSETKVQNTDTTTAIVEETGSVINDETGILSQDSYVRALEKQLAGALQYMEGVGKVKVMITVKSTEERIVEKDSVTSRDSTSQIESGNTKTDNAFQNSETTIYKEDENGNQVPYVVKKIMPNIEGVVVVAQGGGNATVIKNITDVIQALFGVEAHKIKVVKMKS